MDNSRYRFRAWDKKEQKWLPINEDGEVVIFGNGSRGLVDSSGITTHPDYVGDEVLEIMMFTGLYDKDKTPIYEGDIIKIDGSFTIYQDSVGVVKFKKGIFYVETTRYGKEQDYIIDERLDKIIGSIHENPELLHKEMKS